MATACKHAGAVSQIELGDVAEGQVYFTQRLGSLQWGSSSQSYCVLLSSVFSVVGFLTHGSLPEPGWLARGMATENAG